MLTENDTILIRNLIDSYRGQLVRYCDLRDVTRRMLGRLVLTRGDFSRVMDHLHQKRQLLEAIEEERARIAEQVEEWQRRKKEFDRCAETDLFDEVLRKVTDAIQAFLDDEVQVRRYLESAATRSTGLAASP